MQMAVLLDDFEKANSLLDGDHSTASKFGTIRYYEDEEILKWEKRLTVSETFGIRTFRDLQQDQDKHGDENRQDKMMQSEMRVVQIPEYRNIAFFHHFVLKKDQQIFAGSRDVFFTKISVCWFKAQIKRFQFSDTKDFQPRRKGKKTDKRQTRRIRQNRMDSTSGSAFLQAIDIRAPGRRRSLAW